MRPAPAVRNAPPAWRLVLRGLRELAGFDRGVFYDLPQAEAPARQPGTPIFLRGSAAWQEYLWAREQLDTGDLTLLLALRPLGDGERLLAVDWGNTYANAFLLVEPRDPLCDLTDPDNGIRRIVEAAARALLRRHDPDANPTNPWTRDTALGEALRDAFGAWVTWTAPPPIGGVPERVPLVPADSQDTLARLLALGLRERFPQGAFDEALADLLEKEPELFSGRPVARARMPFLTRLGLPVLHDPRCADRAVRRLVNEGRVWLFEQGPDAVSYHGPARPVPPTMPDSQFEQLII